MEETQELIEVPEEEPVDQWKWKVMLAGGLIGALTGLGAAYLLVKRFEKEGAQPNMSAGEGVKLGVLVFGLLRQITQLGGGE
jgi:flagellar biogenesis protein FliO